MSETVNQPHPINPTNKLTAATIGAALASLIQAAVVSRWPAYNIPDIWIPLAPFISGITAFIAGWLVRDRPNVPVKDRADA